MTPEIIRKLMGAALEVAIRFFFCNFTYTFEGEIFKQMTGGPIGARITMCVARLVLQQWRDDYAKILMKAGIDELLSKIYVDDNRNVVKKLKPGQRFDEEKGEFRYEEMWEKEDKEENSNDRTKREIIKAMNSVNADLKFTVETEEDFQSKRLPTLSFEIWSCKEGIRHSYYEKETRSQILTMKRSAQSENSKYAILTNELSRRFLMMDELIDKEERIQKVDHFTKQLINSGYSWKQSRDIIVSALKGIIKKEEREKERGAKRYRTGEESLEERLRKHLTEATEWYKKGGRDEIEEESERSGKEEKERSRAWRGWRIGRKMGRKYTNNEERATAVEEGLVRGVLFLPFTENSELARRVRERLKQLEEISSLRVRVVERTGEKLVDLIHKSNP